MKILIISLVVLSAIPLWSCDMFALILTGSSGFCDHEETVNEFFDFLISRSSEDNNNDGYGLVAYRRDDPHLLAEDCWYKTGYSTWYGFGDEEPLDDAREAILSEDNNYFLIIAHARSATGGSGSHPFRINTDQRTYSMCHNGVIPISLRQAMMDFLGEIWFEQYPSNWLGAYGSLSTFIDSELYFHYLVKYILDNDENTEAGLEAGYSETNLLSINPSYYLLDGHCSANMLFSDGTFLYAFKNTSDQNANKLSWENYGDIIGIKTQSLLEHPLGQNELIRFTAQGEVSSTILEFEEEEPFVPAVDFYAQPNPAKDFVDIYYVNSRADDNNHDDVDAIDRITIYDIRGRKIRSITSSLSPDNYRCYHWDCKVEKGRKAAAGIYLFQHDISHKTGKFVLIK